MFRWTPLLLATLALPIEAQALSCLAPSTANGFLDAQAANEPYIAAVGTLTFDQDLLPRPGQEGGTEFAWLPARLDGMRLSPTGFDAPIDQDVTLKVTCWQPWCGSARSGQTYLVFVRVAEKVGPTVEVEPCPRFLFPDPTEAQLNVVVNCAQGSLCEQGMGEY